MSPQSDPGHGPEAAGRSDGEFKCSSVVVQTRLFITPSEDASVSRHVTVAAECCSDSSNNEVSHLIMKHGKCEHVCCILSYKLI